MAHPLRSRLPISEEALSDCSRRRLDSSVSAGGAKTGELRVLDTSVGGVDERDICEPDVRLDDESEMLMVGFDRGAGKYKYIFDSESSKFLSTPPGLSSQLAQKCVIGVRPFGERIIGTLHPGVEHCLSVKTYGLILRRGIGDKGKPTHPCNMYSPRRSDTLTTVLIGLCVGYLAKISLKVI